MEKKIKLELTEYEAEVIRLAVKGLRDRMVEHLATTPSFREALENDIKILGEVHTKLNETENQN